MAWHRPVEKAERYHVRLLATGLKDYAAIHANLGLFLFKRTAADITQLYTLTFGVM